jgi:hypothetical protein
VFFKIIVFLCYPENKKLPEFVNYFFADNDNFDFIHLKSHDEIELYEIKYKSTSK